MLKCFQLLLGWVEATSVTSVRESNFQSQEFLWLSKCIKTIKCWFLMYPDTDSLIAAVANRCFRYGSNFNRHRGFFWLSDRRCQVSSIHCICSSGFRWKWILAQDLQDLSWKTWPKMPKSNKHTDVWVRNWLDNHGMPRKKSGHFTNKTHWKRPQGPMQIEDSTSPPSRCPGDLGEPFFTRCIFGNFYQSSVGGDKTSHKAWRS